MYVSDLTNARYTGRLPPYSKFCLTVVSCQLSVVSCQLSVVSCQLYLYMLKVPE